METAHQRIQSVTTEAKISFDFYEEKSQQDMAENEKPDDICIEMKPLRHQGLKKLSQEWAFNFWTQLVLGYSTMGWGSTAFLLKPVRLDKIRAFRWAHKFTKV